MSSDARRCAGAHPTTPKGFHDDSVPTVIALLLLSPVPGGPRESSSTTLGRPLVSPGFAGSDRDVVIRLQHRRKISSTLIRNTVVPIAIRTTLGSCLAIEGDKASIRDDPQSDHFEIRRSDNSCARPDWGNNDRSCELSIRVVPPRHNPKNGLSRLPALGSFLLGRALIPQRK